MMKLTLRNLDKALELKIKELAKEKDISLNKAALFLLRKGAGLNQPTSKNTIRDSLDFLVGSWTQDEADNFMKTTVFLDNTSHV